MDDGLGFAADVLGIKDVQIRVVGAGLMHQCQYPAVALLGGRAAGHEDALSDGGPGSEVPHLSGIGQVIVADQTRLGPDNAALLPHGHAVTDPVWTTELSFVNAGELLASVIESLFLRRATEAIDVPAFERR